MQGLSKRATSAGKYVVVPTCACGNIGSEEVILLKRTCSKCPSVVFCKTSPFSTCVRSHGHALKRIAGKASSKVGSRVCRVNPAELLTVAEGMQPSGVGSNIPPPWAEAAVV